MKVVLGTPLLVARDTLDMPSLIAREGDEMVFVTLEIGCRPLLHRGTNSEGASCTSSADIL